MLTAYSDASVCENGTAGTAILLQDDMFIDYALETFYGTSNSGRSKLLAVILAARLVDRNFDTPQEVVIYSDCLTLVNRSKKCLGKKYLPEWWAYKSDWRILMEIAEKHHITIEYVKSHQADRSYNMICDFAARRLARR